MATTWNYKALIALLERSDEALEKAILTINARQTADERATLATRHENGRGWSARDASFGGSLAQWIERGRSEFGRAPGHSLSRAQKEGGRRMVRKYWRQLLEEIASKGGTVDYGKPQKKSAPQRREPVLTAAQEEGHDVRPPNGWFTREEADVYPDF